MGKKLRVIFLVLFLVGLGGGVYLWMQFQAAQDDVNELISDIQHEEMNKEEIHQGLLSEDMTVKLEAEQQLEKFPPEERLAILEEVREHGDRGARLLVIEQLGKMRDVPQAREMLVDLKANDPDRIVKMKAKKVMKTFDGPAKASAEAPEEAPVPTQPAEDTPTPDAG